MIRFYQKDVESSTDFILPDYLGDVKKVLSVSAAAIPSGKFDGEGNVDFSGIVAYDVLYADTDGELTKLTVNSDYDFSLPVDAEVYGDSVAAPKAVNVSVRFTGPRKLVAKSIVSNSVVVSEDRELHTGGDAFESGTPEVRVKNIREENMLFASAPEREYAEEAQKLVGVSSDSVEILATSGAVRIYESIAEDGGVRVKGEMIITSIIRTDDEPPFAIKKVVPFEELVTIEGVNADMQTYSAGYITSVTTGLAEDEEGTAVTVNAIMECTSFAAENKELAIVADAYLADRDTETEYENHTYRELITMGNAESELMLSAVRADIGCDDIREILLSTCELVHVENKFSPHGIELSGDAVMTGVASQITDDFKSVYIPFKFTSPFKLNVNTSCQIPEASTINCIPTVSDIKLSVDAERISARCNVSVPYHVYIEPCVQKVKECNIVGDAIYTHSSSIVTVYYPEDGEKLFDIARKYHTTSAKIAGDSGIAVETSTGGSDSLHGVKRLIIK